MYNNIIIFGAGASFGSDLNNVPPLGNESLFLELRKFDPEGWGKLDNQIAKEFKKDFESAMNNLFESQPYDVIPLQRSMAAYFFRFQPTSNNMYFKVASLIFNTNWNGALITLNYERLLELTLNYSGLTTGYYIRDELPKIDEQGNPLIEICVPHGACHIFCPAITGGGKMKWEASSVETSGHIELVNKQDEFDKRINDALPPVMSYFIQSKQTTSGTDFIQAQRSRYKSLVNEAKNIAIIGLKVRELDKHIWGSLAETQAKLIYLNPDTSEFDKWKSIHRANRKDLVIKSSFQDCFGELCQGVELC